MGTTPKEKIGARIQKLLYEKLFKATDSIGSITPFFDYEVAMDTAKKAWNRRAKDE